jgi:hypothetical protein
VSTIRRQLYRFGVTTLAWDYTDPLTMDSKADIVFLDADLFPIESEPVVPRT